VKFCFSDWAKRDMTTLFPCVGLEARIQACQKSC
jgi:hypothetical protein